MGSQNKFSLLLLDTRYLMLLSCVSTKHAPYDRFSLGAKYTFSKESLPTLFLIKLLGRCASTNQTQHDLFFLSAKFRFSKETLPTLRMIKSYY